MRTRAGHLALAPLLYSQSVQQPRPFIVNYDSLDLTSQSDKHVSSNDTSHEARLALGHKPRHAQVGGTLSRQRQARHVSLHTSSYFLEVFAAIGALVVIAARRYRAGSRLVYIPLTFQRLDGTDDGKNKLLATTILPVTGHSEYGFSVALRLLPSDNENGLKSFPKNMTIGLFVENDEEKFIAMKSHTPGPQACSIMIPMFSVCTSGTDGPLKATIALNLESYGEGAVNEGSLLAELVCRVREYSVRW